MSKVQYEPTSPYYKTGLYGNFLDIATLPVLPKKPDDILFVVNKIYQFRPDLLSNDLYGDSGYWWVFAVRNPNVIQDPVFDMKLGVQIYLPKKDTLTNLNF